MLGADGTKQKQSGLTLSVIRALMRRSDRKLSFCCRSDDGMSGVVWYERHVYRRWLNFYIYYDERAAMS